jgi:hypothetical protein
MLLWYEMGNCFIVRVFDERRILTHERLRSVNDGTSDIILP